MLVFLESREAKMNNEVYGLTNAFWWVIRSLYRFVRCNGFNSI